MIILRALMAVLAVSCLSAAAEASVIYHMSGGKLLRANNIEIAPGVFYTVRFSDGSCFTDFSGCDDEADLDLGVDDALLAANALIAQLLKDDVSVGGAVFDFDSDPGLLFGCDGDLCDTNIPFGLMPRSLYVGWEVGNGDAVDDAFVRGAASSILADNAEFPDHNWAHFTLQPAEIPALPEPATVALLGLGLLGLGVAKRRRSGC